MYTSFYGLREKPFSLTPDPAYLYLAESHREALAHLLYGLEQGEGFICITGEVGTGKTTICRTLLQRLSSDTEVAFIFNPELSAHELLEVINTELGLSVEGLTRRELVEQLNRFLLERRRERRRVLLIIDEAQNLPAQTLEQIRLLSNLETETTKLIQILLLGQPELDEKLERPELRQLKQRITVRWRLNPLALRESKEYVRHRLRIAAGAERDLFTDASLREIHNIAGGIPRLINVICDRALLAGYASQSRSIGLPLVSWVSREVRGPSRAVQKLLSVGRVLRPPLLLRRAAPMLLLLAGVALGLALFFPRAATDSPSRKVVATEASPAQSTAEALPAVATPAPQPESAPARPIASTTSPPLHDAARPPRTTATAELRTLADLDQSMQALNPPRSLERAVNAVLDTWGLAHVEEAIPNFSAAEAALRERDLSVMRVGLSDLSLLRALNHPVIVPVAVAPAGHRYVAVASLNPDRVSLAGVGNETSFLLPAADFVSRVLGEAFVVWRDFEALPHLIQPGEQGGAVMWLQQRLHDLGHYANPPSGVFDATTVKAVRDFQRDHRLTIDGAVGPLTKMALYGELREYAVPRLRDLGDWG